VLRPLIKVHDNGGIISQETPITRGPRAKEIQRGQIFDISALAESRESAALCLTQPPNLSSVEALEHWISHVSVIANAYKTAGRGNGSSYYIKSVRDVLMQYCDDYNNDASYDKVIEELIEKGEISLGHEDSRVCVYDTGIWAKLNPPHKQFVSLLDRVKLSDPEKGPKFEKIYGSSRNNGSVDKAKVNELKFDPTFSLEIFRLLTYYPLVNLSANLKGKIVGDASLCVELLTCCYRQKIEELKGFRGSEEKLKLFAERYPYFGHENGLAAFIHESLNEEIVPLINASQRGSEEVITDDFILRSEESNIIKKRDESDESEEGRVLLYKYAENGIKSSVLRAVCKTLPKYIESVEDLELFFAMVQLEWGSGSHLGKGHVTLEYGELVCMNDVASKIKEYIKRARSACVNENGEELIRTNLISSLQNLMDNIYRTHPLRSLTLFHEYSVQRLVGFGHFLHISDKKQKSNMKEKLTKKGKR